MGPRSGPVGPRPPLSSSHARGSATHTTSLRRWSPSTRRAYLPWVATAGAATAAVGLLRLAGSSDFERFLGPLPPTLTMAALGVAGLGALGVLERHGFWRRACASRTARGLAVATLATLPFAVVAIAVDVVVGFPQDTNVAWPDAWLFYPAIAVAAETVFHLLPLAGLTWLSGSRMRGRSIDGRTAALIVPTAAVEPAAQVLLGTALPAFVMPHVFVFGLLQLSLLRRYGYLPMLWFRVCYYLLWHVLWGGARLELLL